MLRAEESSPQGLIVVGTVCLNTYSGSGDSDARPSSEALARLQAEALRRSITLDELVADLANSLPNEDPLEAFIGSGSIRARRSGPTHREIRSE